MPYFGPEPKNHCVISIRVNTKFPMKEVDGGYKQLFLPVPFTDRGDRYTWLPQQLLLLLRLWVHSFLVCIVDNYIFYNLQKLTLGKWIRNTTSLVVDADPEDGERGCVDDAKLECFIPGGVEGVAGYRFGCAIGTVHGASSYLSMKVAGGGAYKWCPQPYQTYDIYSRIAWNLP